MAILEDQGGPPTWRFLTKFYNFVWNILTNISDLKNRLTLTNTLNCVVLNQKISIPPTQKGLAKTIPFLCVCEGWGGGGGGGG